MKYFKRWNEHSFSLLQCYPNVCIVELSKTMKNLQVFLFLQWFSWDIHSSDMWLYVAEWWHPLFWYNVMTSSWGVKMINLQAEIITLSQNIWYQSLSDCCYIPKEWRPQSKTCMDGHHLGWESNMRSSVQSRNIIKCSVFILSYRFKSINMHHSSHEDSHWMWCELQTATPHSLELIWYLPC
jgi:hypothetical protein